MVTDDSQLLSHCNNVDALMACNASLYQNISAMLNIIATVIVVTMPVSTSTAECSFSVLRLLKMHFCAAMKEERHTGLALMAIHKDLHFQ
jgi:hypothetical protein